MELILGTAQWGSAYGVTNFVGALTDSQVREIVREAVVAGISTFDTNRGDSGVAGYGSAQELAARFAPLASICTKVKGRSHTGVSISEQLRGSLDALARPRVQACLIHDWAVLSSSESRKSARELELLRSAGLVEEIGISAYGVEEIDRAADAFEQLDRIQVPANILDQRFARSASVARLADMGVRFDVRSIFLQGVLLPEGEHVELGSHDDVVRLRREYARTGLTALEACLSFAKSQSWASGVVVGVTTPRELREIAVTWSRLEELRTVDWAPMASDDLDLIDPRRWKR